MPEPRPRDLLLTPNGLKMVIDVSDGIVIFDDCTKMKVTDLERTGTYMWVKKDD